MAEFLTPYDIANRALDYNGADPIITFSDNSARAAVCARNYDKARVAELRRNVWVFATRKAPLRAVDINTYMVEVTAYNAGDTYPQGSLVTYLNVTYISAQYVAAGVAPGTPNEAFWWVYFGPLTATPWNPPPPLQSEGIPYWSSIVTYNDGQYVIGSNNLVYQCVAGTSLNQNPVLDLNYVNWIYTGTSAAGTTTPAYYAGELIYNTVSNVTTVYQCLTTGTTDDPTAAPALWLASVIYNIGDTVTYSNVVWQSKTDLNTENVPATGPYWEAVPAGQVDQNVGQNWLQLNATVLFERIPYPLGSGPLSQSTTRNIYRLPSGYKRMAPQDPKAGAISYLGAPGQLSSDDWVFEGDYLVTQDVEVIILRFVADIQDVTRMDPMFCEGLSCRLGIEIAPRITNSTAKVNEIAAQYKLFMGEARTVNGIEIGPVEPPLDDYIACRV